jgi:hypothetical protein
MRTDFTAPFGGVMKLVFWVPARSLGSFRKKKRVLQVFSAEVFVDWDCAPFSENVAF